MMKCDISIVLPTFKEKSNLAIFIPQIERGFQGTSIEIIRADENSKDGTCELAESLNQEFGNIRIIERPGLMGIGSALRDGYNTADGEFVLSSDADLSFLVDDMKVLYKKAKEGFDIVLGYKVGYKPLAYIEVEKKPLLVRIKHNISQKISKAGNWIVRYASGIGNIHDFNTNFRILRRTAWLKLETAEDKNFFLFETILRAHRAKFSISEISVTFYDRKFGESKLNFLTEAPRYLKKLIYYCAIDTKR